MAEEGGGGPAQRKAWDREIDLSTGQVDTKRLFNDIAGGATKMYERFAPSSR